jgi:hypothetical protein
MQLRTIASWACAGFALLACGASDDATDDPDLARFSRHPGGHTGTTASGTGGASTSGTGAGGGTGSAAGCDVCKKANDCCNVVSGGPLCTFSAETCNAEPAAARGPYINGCLTMLAVTSSAWSGNPPAACK